MPEISAEHGIRQTRPRFETSIASTLIRALKEDIVVDQEVGTSSSSRRFRCRPRGKLQHWLGSSHLPQALRSRHRGAGGSRGSAPRRHTQSGGWSAASGGRNNYDSKELMHTLLGGVLGYRRGRKRHLDRSGTGLRQPNQPRVTLL